MLSTGQLLADRYRLAGRIAVGGMGEVWQANDTRLDRTVAVKVLKAELSGDAEFLHRFRTEARTTASLNHPNVAGVHDYGETIAGEHSIAYLVMELVEGEPLAGILAREGRLNADRTLDILEQAGHALQAAHERGLVHRDVKPGNILISSGGQVKLTDFGIAKAADAAPVTRSGMVMGTAHYIAPEQALGADAEPASDVYSLAVCGYECLTGYRPFLSENAVTVAMMHIRDMPPPLPPDVPPGARAVIEATLIKDPRQRYNSGGEFANAVAAVRAGHPLPTPVGLLNTAYAAGPNQAMAMPPSGPLTPAPAATGPGPASHPAMHPVAPPGLAHPPVQRHKRGHPALWVVLVVVVAVLVTAAVLLIPRLLRDEDGGRPTVGPGEAPPGTSQPARGIPEPTAPNRSTGPSVGDEQGEVSPDRPTTEINGLQGMMSTPWTERNGNHR
ncbi:serine/threonine-protein kinase [Amycolatopsis nigrescens]|uniref:serine/threonine-protein kinase n=1 Tax=Amycolatopsis nigrescens TaxID=381445 RepID=UPI000371C076|nr:serine/threonine-protein kinase [Amycolatopsis nigrescens]